MSATKTADDLRERLFAAIDGVRDKSLSIEQAKTIGELSQVVVNLAKVEEAHARATEGRSKFLSEAPPALPNGITAITQHRIKG